MNVAPEPRSIEPSNSVVRSITLGTPAGTVLGYLAAVIAEKYKIPFDVVGAGLGLISTAFMGVVQYFSRGGRKGEPL